MPTWPEQTGPLEENELCPPNCPHLKWRLPETQRGYMGTTMGGPVQGMQPINEPALPECWFSVRVMRDCHLRLYGSRAIKSWTCPMEKKR